MVDEERIRELDDIDRRYERRRRLTIGFFALLSVLLVIYAVSIERKIQKLSQNQAVVVYRDVSEEGRELPETELSTDSTEDTVSLKQTEPDKTVPIGADEAEAGQIYYITSSGKKYHKAGCSYLSKSRIAITQEQLSDGGYTACSRCIKE